ncbi:MAG: LacI family DNA-binding transcriptional regulator [Halanaerobiaceae bacterium]
MVTINDIARKANVSKSTVSKVINNYPGVKDETREKVLKVMQENNYWPNAVARSLSTSKSYIIGMFVPSHLNNFFFREVIRGVEEVFGEMGYDLLYFTNERWDEKGVDFSYVEKCQNRNVDGAMLMGFGDVEETQFACLVDSDIPTVFIDRAMTGNKTSYLISDNKGGAQTAVKYLYQCGHRKLGIFTGPRALKTARDRLVGFRETVEELDLSSKPEWFFSADYDRAEENGYEFMEEILSLKEKPTAVFGEDMFLIGAIKCLRERGLDVPKDFSFVGFDNIELSRHYKLTTVSQKKLDMGRSAARLLLSIMEEEVYSPVVMPTELVERNSCRPLN